MKFAIEHKPHTEVYSKVALCHGAGENEVNPLSVNFRRLLRLTGHNYALFVRRPARLAVVSLASWGE